MRREAGSHGETVLPNMAKTLSVKNMATLNYGGLEKYRDGNKDGDAGSTWRHPPFGSGDHPEGLGAQVGSLGLYNTKFESSRWSTDNL